MTARNLLLAGMTLLLAVPGEAREEKMFSTRTIRESLSIDAGAACRLIVDNVWGDVRVVAHDRATVSVAAVETVWAESDDAGARAAREVELDIGQRSGEVELFVDGPFRDRHDRRRWSDHHRHPGYTVVYDLEVRVPARCDLDIRTVNDGEVEVSDVAGALDVSNVNGGIRLDRVAGTGGEVTTVNGDIVGRFLNGPTAELGFETINGRIDVTFPPALAADLRLDSKWGEMRSEFELEPLPVPPAQRRRKDGRLVIEIGHGAWLRAGAGGPEISFQTLNGDILIRKEG